MRVKREKNGHLFKSHTDQMKMKREGNRPSFKFHRASFAA
jgi:hypothetical protein